MNEGRVLTGSASGSVRLESREEVEAKFRNNAERTISADDAQRSLDAVCAAEPSDVTGLIRLAAG
jgi:hypothetical protein